MGVTVHKTGHGHHAGTVHDGGRLALRQSLTYVRNFTASHGNVCAEQHIHFLIHGHNSDVGN